VTAVRTQDNGTLSVAVRLLRSYLPAEALRSLLGLLLLLGVTAATLLRPWPLKLVVDSVLGDHRPPPLLDALSQRLAQQFPFLGGTQLALLLVLCCSVFGIELLVGLFNVLSTYVLTAAGLRMVFKLRCVLFDHMQRLSLSFHDRNTVGDSLYRVAWDSYCVQTLFNGGVVPAITALITLAGILVVMLSVDKWVTLAALAVAIPLIWLILRLDRPMTERSLRVHERESDVSTRVQETLAGIRAVQAFGQEDFEGSRFRTHAGASLHANLLLTVLQTGSQAIVSIILAAGTAAVIGLAAVLAVHGHLSAGDVVLLASYVAMLYKPLETLAYTAAIVQGAVAGARRVFAILDAAPAVTDQPGAIDLTDLVRGEVMFDHVSFGYTARSDVLNDVSLRIPAGTTTAIVGASGAGKSTLASLLFRFYDAGAGSVRLDGHDLRDLTLRSLRANVALVLQEPILFSASIRENIAYGRPGASDDQVIAAARAAGAHGFIEALPEGYETQIGERGVSLSGGQRQRLSIARAFLKDAPVLIMDEPTSALDPASEAEIVGNLAALMQGRTTLIIAHRLSTIRGADQIAVLRDGRIVELGTQADLLQRRGDFQRLYQLQFGDATPSAQAVPVLP
jgi:ABC-type multidrug transport system fused ATPase/permease subunit